MTAPPRRIRRAARDPRQPSHAYRALWGPRPPDGVIAELFAALEQELAQLHADADPAAPEPPTLGERWRQALLAAAAAIAAAALLGVERALGAVPATDDPPDEEEWMEETNQAVQRTLAGSARAGLLALLMNAAHAAIVNAVLARHSAAVAWYARAAGSEEYIWTTQLDGIVRPLHQELEGTRQRWDDPPLSGTGGFHGHPGEPARCRCAAFPVLPTTPRVRARKLSPRRVARSN